MAKHDRPTHLTQLHYQRSPVECQRCHRQFREYEFVEIGEATLLTCNDGRIVITDLALACLRCKRHFYYHLSLKEGRRSHKAIWREIGKIQHIVEHWRGKKPSPRKPANYDRSIVRDWY